MPKKAGWFSRESRRRISSIRSAPFTAGGAPPPSAAPCPAPVPPRWTPGGGLRGAGGRWTSTCPAILDSAMACAVHTTLAAGQGYTTVEMKLNFVRPILPNIGKVTCEGVLIHRGGTLATSEGKLFDAQGKLLAHGTETCMIFDAASKAA